MKLKHEFPEEFFKEETATFVIDRERKRLWAALLDLLAEFDRVCRKHGLKYSIDGGTLLGKARHNGIIPWDDDIDVIMMRGDYEKLKLVAADEFKDPYFLQTMESDPEACRGHPQLRNSSMTAIRKSEFENGKAIWNTFNQGLYMDIFVLDAIPDESEARKNFFAELISMQCRMWQVRYWKHMKLNFAITPRRFYAFCLAILARCRLSKLRRSSGMDPLVYVQQVFDCACQCCQGSVTKELSHVSFEPDPKPSRVFLREKLVVEHSLDMLNVEDIDFMGVKLMMIKEWAYYLENLYGDWHKYVVGGDCHGGSMIDLDHPYTDYF